ncbi:hypothetical protein CS0771_60000 [Catellatospora sp. IY07-71]|uniref:HAMP domain-containing protein n=1 Tax=Catellatospora sp. IY07-71 TaxID=2728827 RepID=UPI001BB3F83C|nr:HAMP domain-containing protein [Catellatospora sp. IY07-71]BCJ76456.1 hypothetical protein CS0771_60000 [Catellatospora sp. IY07-71]
MSRPDPAPAPEGQRAMTGSSSARSREELIDEHMRAERDVLKWRRRALDQQLPAVGFPNGAGAPSTVYLLAMVVLALTAVAVFAANSGAGVPQAVLDSQRDSVSKLARSIDAAYRLDVETVERAVDTNRTSAATDPKHLLEDVLQAQSWSGAAVLDTATSAVQSTAGLAIPADLLAAPRSPDGTATAITDDGPSVLHAEPLDETHTLIAFQPVRMRNLRLNPDADHGVHLLTTSGGHTLVQGVAAVDEQTLTPLFTGLGAITASTSSEHLLPGDDRRRLVVAAAPIRSAGLVVASLVSTEVAAGTPLMHGIVLGGSLLVAALTSFALMRLSLLVPLRRLLRRAKADACGEPVKQRQSLRTAEMFRIARALAVSSNASLRARRWRPAAVTGLVASTVVTLAWAGAVATVAYRTRPAEVPAQLVIDEENRAESAAVMLGHVLDTGLSSVSRLVGEVGAKDPAAAERRLERVLADEDRFRSVYLVDAAGRPVAQAGAEPLRQQQPLAGEIGVRLDQAAGRVPVIYAYRVAGDGNGVVAEFDVDGLRGVLRQSGGRARVVDAEMRTVLDSEGYLAFQPLAGTIVQRVATATLPGGTASETGRTTAGHVLVAATGLVNPTTVAHLEWSLVVEQDVAAMWLPQSTTRRWTLLAAGIAAAFAVLTLAWHFFVFVRPLRRLADTADRISGGDFEMPVPPQRHDEIGIIAMCLEICRQVRHTGSARFGGAVRMRGSESDFTSVLPRARSRRPETAEA